MTKVLKWFGISIGLLLLIVFCAVWILTAKFNRSFNKTYIVRSETVQVPDDSVSIEKGRQLASLCTSCHGKDLGGQAIIDDPKLATIYAANLTSGQGGIGSKYSVEDWVRAIRHGVGPDKKPLFVMPAQEYNHLSKPDLSNLIAYLRTLPPIDNESRENSYTTTAKVLGSLGAFGILFPASVIDHNAPFREAPDMAVSIEYGSYMVDVGGCRTCHGKALNGGKDPNPEAPPGPNLTPGGNIGVWSEDQFIHTLKTGKTPEGKVLNPEFMPWTAFGQLDEVALRALYQYLRSLPIAESAVKVTSE